MHSIQVADETFVAASATSVAAVVHDRESWRRWWPDLGVRVAEDRGDQGVRWGVSGPVVGTMEIWLQPMLDGVVLHYFLHAEPAAEPTATGRRPAADQRRGTHARRVAGRVMSTEVKRRAEAGRAIGDPALPKPSADESTGDPTPPAPGDPVAGGR